MLIATFAVNNFRAVRRIRGFKFILASCPALAWVSTMFMIFFVAHALPMPKFEWIYPP